MWFQLNLTELRTSDEQATDSIRISKWFDTRPKTNLHRIVNVNPVQRLNIEFTKAKTLEYFI